MPRTFKGRRQAVDNITVGSDVISQERTIAGSLPPAASATWGNIENIAVATNYGIENVVVKAATLMLMDRIGTSAGTSAGTT